MSKDTETCVESRDDVRKSFPVGFKFLKKGVRVTRRRKDELRLVWPPTDAEPHPYVDRRCIAARAMDMLTGSETR